MQRHAASSIAGSAQTWRRIEAVLARNARYRPEAVTSIAVLGVRDADIEAQCAG